VIPIILIALAYQAAAPQPAAAARDAKSLTFSTPVTLVEVDSGKLKGEPVQLAWSPDATKLYLQTGQRTRIGTMSNQRSYLIDVADRKVTPVEAAPDWAKTYWTWKSNKWAPGDRAMAIELEGPVQRRTSGTASPTGGELAKGGTPDPGGGTTVEDAARAAYATQVDNVLTLKLKGEIVGEYVNLQFMPGYTFGWAPQNLGNLIAYRNAAGRLAVLDRSGAKQEIPSTKNVWVPAWTDDGSKIAFVQQTGRTKYAVTLVDVK
jgi:hypothetical protein